MADQQNLFGEIDAVYNTLETELKFVNDEISKNQKSIDRAKEKIMALEERRTEIKKSIKIVKAQRDHAKEEEEIVEEIGQAEPEEEELPESDGTVKKDPF